jgi:hypothetical protein
MSKQTACNKAYLVYRGKAYCILKPNIKLGNFHASSIVMSMQRGPNAHWLGPRGILDMVAYEKSQYP